MGTPPVRGATHVTNIRGREGEQGPAGTFVDAHAVVVPADETDLKPILSGPADARQILFKVPRGLPADGAADNDAAQAARMAAADSLLHQATDAAFGAPAILNPESAQGDAVAQVAAARVAAGAPGMITIVDARGNNAAPRPAGWLGQVLWMVTAGQLNPTHWAPGDMVARTTEEFNPLSLPGLVGLWDARTLNLADNAPVTSWPNSVLGMPALTGNGDAVMDRDGMRGFPAVRFNGASGVLTSGLFEEYQGESTVYVVAQSTPAATSGTDFIYDGIRPDGPSLALALARNATGNWVVQRAGSFQLPGADALPHILRVEYRQNSTSTLWVDGVELGSGSTNNNVPVVRYTLGGRGDASAANTHVGPIAAFAVIRGRLSPTDDFAFTKWLRERFGF